MKNERKQIRFLSLLAAMLLAVSPLVGCGSSDTPEKESQTGTAEQATTEKPDLLKENIGAYDFGGEDFDIVYSADQCIEPYDSDQPSGIVLDNAVYERNLAVEETYHVNLVWHSTGGDWSEVADEILKNVMTGSKADGYDLGIPHVFAGLPNLVDGKILDWNTVPVVNFSKPWWNQTFAKNLAVDDVILIASNDMVYQRPTGIFFNKKMLNALHLDNPYDMVRNGTWTWDVFATMSATVEADSNGDGKFDDKDNYGFLCPMNFHVNDMLFSMGATLCEKNEDGDIVLDNIGSEKMKNVVDKMYKVIYNGNTTYAMKHPNVHWHDYGYNDMFAAGQALFMQANIQATNYMRDVNFDFGLLPMPKYDEAQEKYLTLGSTQVLVVPATTESEQRTGVIAEALAITSHEILVPAVYDTTYGNQRLKDADSYEMFQIMRASLVYDFNWNFGNANSICYMAPNLMEGKNTNVASFYRSYGGSVQKQLDSVVAKIRQYYE